MDNGAGDGKTSSIYKDLLEGVASFGFIAIAPRSLTSVHQTTDLKRISYWIGSLHPNWVTSRSPLEDTLGITKFINNDAGYG